MWCNSHRRRARSGDGVLPPLKLLPPPAKSKTDTFANDYFTLMPGFTVERDVTWFRYGDIPEAFRREIAPDNSTKTVPRSGRKPSQTRDIIYPVYGPVGWCADQLRFK